MILKHADSKTQQIVELQQLQQKASASVKSKIDWELKMLHAGMKGENEAAYLIDFDLKDSQNTVILHDLRLEANGRVAQIDHLLIHRTMAFFILETKNFHAGVKIDNDGQFLQWNNFKKTFEGMSSPLAQNERHIAVLKDVVDSIEWPTRLGLKLSPVYESLVLVSSKARIDRPKKFDTSRIIKVEELGAKIDKTLQSRGVFATLTAVAKMVSTETIVEIGQSLVNLHRPIVPDYAAKFGLNSQTPPGPAGHTTVTEVSTNQEKVESRCRKCNNTQISIAYGKYGYYFKCSSCDGNTPIKLSCGQKDHKERLRKDGPHFYRECPDCCSSSLFFTNP